METVRFCDCFFILLWVCDEKHGREKVANSSNDARDDDAAEASDGNDELPGITSMILV